jgi:hypothetical protein
VKCVTATHDESVCVAEQEDGAIDCGMFVGAWEDIPACSSDVLNELNVIGKC